MRTAKRNSKENPSMKLERQLINKESNPRLYRILCDALTHYSSSKTNWDASTDTHYYQYMRDDEYYTVKRTPDYIEYNVLFNERVEDSEVKVVGKISLDELA